MTLEVITPEALSVVEIRALDWATIAKAVDAQSIRARMSGIVERMEVLLDRPGGPGLLFDVDREHVADRAIQVSATNDDSPLWIIGDLHGDLLALEAALAQINHHASADVAPPRIIFSRRLRR